MKAVFWILHTDTQKILFRKATVQGTALKSPSHRYSVGVNVPFFNMEPTPIPNAALVAEFELFDMVGWEPNVTAHYRLASYPPPGWRWTLHPTKHALVLSESR